MYPITLTQDDNDLITLAAGAGGCSLNSSPGKNWVEKSGGLPNYICRIARAIARGSKGKSSAIAIAISRVKTWAAGGGDVDADTRAKAAKAVAQWEALKARNKARKVNLANSDYGTYLQFSNTTSFNTEVVNQAWRARSEAARAAARAERRAMGMDPYDIDDDSVLPYTWIKELWTDFIIVQLDTPSGGDYVKIPYTVDDSGEVTFGDPIEVAQTWVEQESDDEELTDAEKALLADILLAKSTSSERMIRLAATLGFHIS